MKGKGEGRTSGLNPEARTALQAWITEAQLTSGPLFPSQKRPSEAIDRRQAWRILDKAYDANSLRGKLGTHAMRKTFAGKAYALLDHDLVNTQRALGHKNINSTVSYLSFNDTAINDAIMRM
jgi:integrase